MIASWPSTVRVICMLNNAAVAIRISSPTAMPKIFKPIGIRMTPPPSGTRPAGRPAGRQYPLLIIAEALSRRSFSANRELGGAEIVLALGGVDRALPLTIGQHRDPALHRRPGRHFVVPAFDRGIVGEIDVAPLGTADPREGDDVGHAVFVAGEPVRLLEPMVEHPVQALDLVGVALDR